MFASESIEEVIAYFFYQGVNLITGFTEDMNAHAVTLFDQPFVSGIVQFFQLLAMGLALFGTMMAVFEFIIAYQEGRSGSFSPVGINLIKTWFAAFLFSTVPIMLYKLSIDIYGAISGVLTSSVAGTAPSWETYIEAYFGQMLNIFAMGNPIFRLGSQLTGVWDFLAGLTGTTEQPFVMDWMLVVQLLIMIYVFIKVFLGNLKRGALILIMVCTGSLHMAALPRGFSDGWTAWCKQVVALCFTVFMQNCMFTVGILLSENPDSLYLALGLLLGAAEVPRIAQMFGLDTSSKGNIGTAMHTASSAMMMLRMVR